MGRLSRATLTRAHAGGFDGYDETFNYDSIGNLLSIADAEAGTASTFLPDISDPDRLCRSASDAIPGTGCTHQYDGAGNVASITDLGGGPTRTFAFDSASRLTEISNSAGRKSTFEYDAFGYVARETHASPYLFEPFLETRRFGDFVESQTFVEDPDAPIFERRIPGPGGTVATRRGTGATATTHYAHGSEVGPRVFTDSTGEVSQSVRYRPFGRVDEDTGSHGSISTQSYLFNDGEVLRPYGLMHIGARLYDPTTGRFLQRDPIGLPGLGSSANPYAFAYNDPINLTDPSGMLPGLCKVLGSPALGCSINPQGNAQFFGIDLGGIGAAGVAVGIAFGVMTGEVDLGVSFAHLQSIALGGGRGPSLEDLLPPPELRTEFEQQLASNTTGWNKLKTVFYNQTTGEPFGYVLTSAGYAEVRDRWGAIVGAPVEAGATSSLVQPTDLLGIVGTVRNLGSVAVRGAVLGGRTTARAAQRVMKQLWLRSVKAFDRASSRVLAQNLKNAGFAQYASTAAHHIVQGGRNWIDAVKSREILRKFNIGINDEANGVFLPTKRTPYAVRGTYHPSLHTKDYTAEVYRRLSTATTRQEAIEILNDIRGELLDNTFRY